MGNIEDFVQEEADIFNEVVNFFYALRTDIVFITRSVFLMKHLIVEIDKIVNILLKYVQLKRTIRLLPNTQSFPVVLWKYILRSSLKESLHLIFIYKTPFFSCYGSGTILTQRPHPLTQHKSAAVIMAEIDFEHVCRDFRCPLPTRFHSFDNNNNTT